MSTQQQNSAQSLVQLDMFSRGNVMVDPKLAQAATVVPHFRKKGGAFVLNAAGEKIETSKVIKLLPLKSKENEDLADLTGLTGQSLKLWAAEAGHRLMLSGHSHMTSLVSSGNYTLVKARSTSGGRFLLEIKPALGKVAIMTTEQLVEQAKALGYTLVPQSPDPEPEAPEEVENNGAAVVVETKASKKAAKAAKAAVAA